MTQRLRSPLASPQRTPLTPPSTALLRFPCAVGSPTRLEWLESLASCPRPPSYSELQSPETPPSWGAELPRRFKVEIEHASLAHFCLKATKGALWRWRSMGATSAVLEAKVSALVYWREAGRAWRILLAYVRGKRYVGQLRRLHALRRLRVAAASSSAAAAASFATALNAVSSAALMALARGWFALFYAASSGRSEPKLVLPNAFRCATLALRTGWGTLLWSFHRTTLVLCGRSFADSPS